MPTLNWIGKESVINHHHDVPFRTLEQKYTFGEGTDGNKIIHGDNLEALKALLPEYEGRIKCIYIDPPYNTGNENWVYNDNVNSPKIRKWLGQVVGKEAEDLTRHDKWLCMMYPRLKLLQRLLSDDGAIFISIDDNEQANLKLICDEIFGAGNFVAECVWQKKYGPANDAKYLSNTHEYIECFAKDITQWKPFLIERNDEQLSAYKNPDNDPRGLWRLSDLSARTYSANTDYEIVSPKGKVFLPPKSRSWIVTKERYEELFKDNRIAFGIDGNGRPMQKKFLTEVKQGITPQTWWDREFASDNKIARYELKELFPNNPFDTPKPTQLIKRILQISSSKSSIILDSFAGSGTTAHAVLNLNKQDGGDRKFILVEMEDYAENITAERVRRVIKGYGEDKNAVEGTGGSFSFYELGEPVFNEDGYMNEKIGREKLCEYIWYTETRTPYATAIQPNKYLLGIHQDTSYYFYYEPEKITTLSHDTLNIISEKAETYVVYADQCVIDKEWLSAHNIIFKKIPRDISRF
ncbi:MAG: site-specific DNA-methyltransferase [Paludibacteraceae bacterium]|nr:site-specific DNA-methyltransferase [Paludibacteraceae bacterium]